MQLIKSVIEYVSCLFYISISVVIQRLLTWRCILEQTKRQVKVFFLSRNVFIFPYAYHRSLFFVSWAKMEKNQSIYDLIEINLARMSGWIPYITYAASSFRSNHKE